MQKNEPQMGVYKLVFLFSMLFFEITLVYLGTLNQPINCPNSLNLVSRDLCRA